MKRERRSPKTFGVLTVLFVVLILSQLGCENGNLGLKGGNITGTVVDGRTLTGLSGVSITATSGEEGNKASKSTTSDSNGNYHFSDVRADEWKLSFDKFGYAPIVSSEESGISLVVVNSETADVPQVRMNRQLENQYITITGNLKDEITGSTINYGNAQFIFGQESFSNRMPTELQTGFRIPAASGAIKVQISVAGYEPWGAEIFSGQTDRDLGSILLKPETYNIVGRWSDVPGWVFQDAPKANIFAYAGNKVVATANSNLNEQQFEIEGIPRGTSVSVEVEVKGYRMNGPVVVHPTGDFQGTIYQNFSLKNNFSQILRDVRLIISGNGISSGDFVGGFCEETGTQWPKTIVSNPPGFTGPSKVIDLDTQKIPTGYTFTFNGYIVGQGHVRSKPDVFVSDDGNSAQIVAIEVN